MYKVTYYYHINKLLQRLINSVIFFYFLFWHILFYYTRIKICICRRFTNHTRIFSIGQEWAMWLHSNVALTNIMVTEGGFIHSQQIVMEIFIKLFVN